MCSKNDAIIYSWLRPWGHDICDHTHTHLTALCPGLPRWAGTRKVKPIWILLKQQTVSGSGISWTIYKSAPCSRQITCQHPTTQFFTGRVPLLLPNQQCQSTEGNAVRRTSGKLFTSDQTYHLPSVLWRCWLGGRKGIRPVKNWVVGCWSGYLSGVRCRLAYGPADATATYCLLRQ